MKIFVVDQSFFGLLYDVQFAAALANAGASVTLLGRPLRDYEEVNTDGFEMLPMFYGISERLPRYLKGLARKAKGFEHARGMAALEALVRRERPEVVHFQWIVLPLLDRWFLSRLARLAPLVLTVHNTVPWHGNYNSSLMVRGFGTALRCFDHYIAHTQGIRDYLRVQSVPSNRIDFFQHPAVRLPRAPDRWSRSEPRRPEAPIEILFFGNIKPYKGVDVLVRAGLELAKRRRDFRITIAGKAFFELSSLEAAVEGAGAGNLFSFQARHQSDRELSAKLENSDIVVFPYREIDASGAFACASQFGKPILATKIGVFIESPLRDYLCLVPPDDPIALAATLEDLIANPVALADLTARAAALRDAMPTWEGFASYCLELYGRLGAVRLGGHPRRTPTGSH